MNTRTVTVLKVIGIIAVVLGILYVVVLGLAYQSLRRAYAALEADGRPMTAEQIIPAEIPDADNAALIYDTVVLQLKAEQAGDQNLFERLKKLAQEVLKEAPDLQAGDSFRQLFGTKPVQEALAALEKAKTKGGCRYDHEYSRGAELVLPHLMDLRDLSRILCASARIHADAGDLDTAWDNLITSLHLADALRDEPLLISQLVRIAQFSITIDAIQAVAPLGRPSAAQLETLLKRLEEFEDLDPYVNALDGERILFGEWAFKSVGQLDEGLSKPLKVYSYAAPFMMYDHAAYLTYMNDSTKNARVPFSASDADGDDALDNLRPYHILTSLLAPALSAAKGRYTAMTAQAKVSRAGLAALQYHETQGRFPADLESLGLPGLVDPFGGQSLVYRTAPAGFLVYSLGANVQDDGGMPSAEQDQGDLVWTFPGRRAG